LTGEVESGEPGKAVPKRRRARRFGRIALIALAALTVVVLAVGVYAYVLVARIPRVAVDLPETAPGGRTYLIVGVDSRADLSEAQHARFGATPGARADIVMLMRVPSDGSTPVLVSVPRDLLVLGDDAGLHRLALQWLDGPQALVDSLCTTLGVGADHLIVIEMDGFIDLIDAVGGIDIEFPEALRDTKINFAVEPGVQHLDGERALQYVRARQLEHLTIYGWFPAGNQRDEQARAVVREVAEKAELSDSPMVVYRLVRVLQRSIHVDEGTGLRDLLHFSRALGQVPPDATQSMPVEAGDGPIPFAEVTTGAADVLARAGAGGECEPAVDVARHNGGKSDLDASSTD
jgi:LCP family protein required for cell wall assembly